MSHLVGTEQASQDFNADMQSFFRLFTRYTEGGTARESLYVTRFLRCLSVIISYAISHRDWGKVKPPPRDQILSYEQLPELQNPDSVTGLMELAVLKVNGGLGTSMGLFVTSDIEKPSKPPHRNEGGKMCS